MKKMKLCMMVMCICIISTGFIMATGSQDTGTAEEEMVTITSLLGSVNIPAENNSVLQEIRKRTGINYSPIVVLAESYAEKLNAMIASKTLPDIIGPYNFLDGEEFAENGILLELNDLLESHGPEILKNKAKYLDEGLNALGTIWGIPHPSWYSNNFAFRMDWLDNLDMDLPTDLDSLYAVLKAFTEDDPDMDGKDDTIGFGCYLGQPVTWVSIFGAFGVPYLRPIYQDGVVTSHIKHENYLDAIKYFRRLYQEGLMEPDFATIPAMPALEKLWNGIYGTLDFTAVGTTQNWLGRYTEDPKPVFDFAIIKGPEGQGGSLKMYSGAYTGITSTSKNPEKAMELLNFFTTLDGTELQQFGIEGKHYKWIDKEDGKFEYIPPYDDSATLRNDGGGVFGFANRHDDNWDIRTLNELTRKAMKLASDNTLEDAYYFGIPEISKELGATLGDIEKECLASLIVTEGDLEVEYQNFVDRWMAEGGESLEEQATVIYKKENNL